MTTIRDLNPNPRNPRVVSDERLEMLKAALVEFGDLSGFIYNVRTKRLVGGHQRAKVLPKDSKIKIEKKYETPTTKGTTAEGHVSFNGERYKYREVDWDEVREDAALLAANKSAGEWDDTRVKGILQRLNDFDFDVSLTMFDDFEFKNLLAEPKIKKQKEPIEDEGPKEKKRATCPECNHRFVPGWS